ncbi:MAG TPA: GYD domain-containing protein [Candidatus Acidoferrales bacterium]|nr:GYD domain-containing protein [Candidatus Acidoferrales bacterium]
MPLYLTQVAYTQESWQALIKNPQNRIDAIRPAIEKLGGTIINGYFAFGDYDIVAITEMPDNVAAAAIAIAFAAGGACKAVRTTPLLTTAEGVEALRKAGEAGYRPISTASAASAS